MLNLKIILCIVNDVRSAQVIHQNMQNNISRVDDVIESGGT